MAEINEYSALIQADAASATRLSMMDAVDKQPDTEAKLQALAKQYRMPIDAVRLDQPFIEKKAKLDALDYDALARQLPKTAAHLSDPARAAVAHDDIDNMSGIERAVSALGSTAKYVFGAGDRGLVTDVLGGAYFGGGAGAAGAFRAASEFIAPPLDALEQFPSIGGNPLRRLSEGFGMLSADASARLKRISPASGDFIGDAVSSGAQSLGQNLMMMPLAMMPGGQGAALAGMSSQAGGASYQKAREKGVGQNTALAYAASDAVIEYATEKMPMGRLIGDLKAGTPLMKTLMRNIAAEVPGEQVATVLQDMNEWAVLNPEKPFSAYVAERPSAAAQTLIATVIGAGGQVTLMKAAQSSLDAASGTERKAQDAQQSTELIQQISDLAQASKVRGRSAEDFAAFMQSATQDSPVSDLYIDPAALQQSGVDIDALAAASPSVAEQLADAQVSGADIRIPVAEFATAIAGTDFAQSLIPHLRTEVDGMSQAEAEVFMQESGDELRSAVEQSLTRQDSTEAVRASRDAVQADMLAKLTAANVEPDAAKLYAALAAARYGTLAHQLGVTPEEAYAQHPLNVRGAQVADVMPGDLEQIEPVHGVRDKAKFNALVARMEETGEWRGRPVLAFMDASGGEFALTGSHRLAAARKAGVEPDVVYVDDATTAFEDSEGRFLADVVGTGDDNLLAFLREAGDEQAAAQMEEEIEANDAGFVLHQTDQPAAKPARPSPEAIELRKRESILKSMMECLA